MPDPPTIRGAIRSASVDFYFNSWRLVPANALWGAGLIGLLLLAFVHPFAALLAAILLAVPAAGIFRLAALIVRQQPVAFSDALVAWRRFLAPALLTGATLVGATALLGFNVMLGLTTLEPLLWVIGTLAGWGLLLIWAVALPYWVLMVDPLRDTQSLATKGRLAALVVLFGPLRFATLFGLMTLLLIVSTILFAVLLTVSIAFVALVMARYTLPAADRLEGRKTHQLPG